MNLTYYGHSTFAVVIGGKKILFDPFVTYNELAKGLVDAESLEADYIFVSHGHEDHVADLIPIAKRTGATVVAAFEIHAWLQKQGVQKTHPMNTGGEWEFEFGRVKCVVAQHSSGLPDGSYGGNPMGFVFKTKEGSFYFSGDTALTMDMQLVPMFTSIDFAVLPIGDNFTMGATDAVQAAKFVKTGTVVGVHYDTFGFIRIDKEKVRKQFADAGLTLHLPAIGQTIDLQSKK